MNKYLLSWINVDQSKYYSIVNARSLSVAESISIEHWEGCNDADLGLFIGGAELWSEEAEGRMSLEYSHVTFE